MAKLSSDYLRNEGRSVNPAARPWMSGYRSATRVVGQVGTRCGICQRVLYSDDDTEMYEGERCHSDCIETEEQGS